MLNNESLHKLRWDFLFKNNYSEFSEKRILELAPFDGWFTKEFLNLNPSYIEVVELNPSAVETLKKRFEQPIIQKKLSVINKDVHMRLFEYSAYEFDTIVCTGLLYHSPHPLWILEGMARIKPKNIFIETFHYDLMSLIPEPLNLPGMRQSTHPCLPFSMGLPVSTLIDVMEHLGYKALRHQKNGDLISISDFKFENSDLEKYFSQWLLEYSIWFSKID